MSTAISRIPDRINASLTAPWQARLLTIVDAIILNVVILGASRLVMGEYPSVTMSGDEQVIGFAPVILVTALVGLAAWGLLALLELITPRAKTIWTTVAVAVFLLSLLGPLGSGVDGASKLALALLHVGAAGTIIPLMRRSATRP